MPFGEVVDECPNCGQAIREGMEHCPKCGTYVGRGGGGCFIATASYGTPFAKEIDVLRKWRDTSLMSNFFGRIFVKFYYGISPLIANFISKSEKMKKVVRGILNPFVKYLKKHSNNLNQVD